MEGTNDYRKPKSLQIAWVKMRMRGAINCRKMRARLHMSKKSSTFAADFILAYCAYTCTGTYDGVDFPALLDGSVGGKKCSRRSRQKCSRRDGEKRKRRGGRKRRHRR